MKRLLVLSPHPEASAPLIEHLSGAWRIDQVSRWEEGLSLVGEQSFEMAFWDLDTPEEDASGDVTARVKTFFNAAPTTALVLLCSAERMKAAIEGVKAGAHHCLSYPLDISEIELVMASVGRERRTEAELEYLRTEAMHQATTLLDTENDSMREVLEQVKSVAVTKTTVLLIGETGVGKGVVAQMIHRMSTRQRGPFLSVHCGAIPDSLLESEFFGHEKGSFTGAVKRKLGKFEIAKGGTIFLDEIGTISPAAQVRLLRVLQEQVYERVGGEVSIAADVRVVSASNIDLKQMVDDGVFRADLFYRLNVFPIRIPPLRERREDIPHISRAILGRLNETYLKYIEDFHPSILEAFSAYPWPGNIRELENVLERAYVLECSSIFMPESFPAELFAFEPHVHGPESGQDFSLAEARQRGLASIESLYLNDILTKHHGRIKESAGAAGISSRQLHKLMKKYGLRKEAFRRRDL